MKARIYHNPRCSKSRAALALLNERGVTVEIVDYLRQPLTRSELQRLLDELRVEPLEIVRTNEPEYRALAQSGREPTRAEVLDWLAAEPRLLQRPIVEVDGRALIGRPPERVLELVE
jgi:arsenate reductase